MFIWSITILYKILKYFDLFWAFYGQFIVSIFMVFFSININKILFVGPKSVKTKYKAPDILLKYQLKNIKYTYAQLFFISI